MIIEFLDTLCPTKPADVRREVMGRKGGKEEGKRREERQGREGKEEGWRMGGEGRRGREGRKEEDWKRNEEIKRKYK